MSGLLYYREGQSDMHLREIIDRDYVTRWATELNVLDIWQAILQRVRM